MRSSRRRMPGWIATSGTIWSAAPRPRRRCGATGWRWTSSPCARACCATYRRSTASGRFFGQKIRLPVALAPVGSLESLRERRWRDRRPRRRRFWRAGLCQLGHAARARGNGRRGQGPEGVPALRARRSRTGWTRMSGARGKRATTHSASPSIPPSTAVASGTSRSASSNPGGSASPASNSRRR